jgi:hypothetical protein
MENFGISFQFLKESYEELHVANERYLQDHGIEQPRNRQKLESFLLHFQKLLLNYMASFIFFVYQIDVFVEEMKELRFEQDFDELRKAKQLIEKVQFLEDLRRYMHYHKLPFPRIQTDYVPTSRGISTDTIPGFCKGELSLLKKELLGWAGFSPISKLILRSYLGNVIIIVSIAKLGFVDKYQATAKELFNWLKIKADEKFHNEIKDFVRLQKEIDEISTSLHLR